MVPFLTESVLCSQAQSMASLCRAWGFRMSVQNSGNLLGQWSVNAFCLWPTPVYHVESVNGTLQWAGKMKHMLQAPACAPLFQIVPARTDDGVFPKLSALFPVCSTALSALLARIRTVE